MQLCCLQLEASCLQLSSFAYSCVWELFCIQLELLYFQFNRSPQFGVSRMGSLRFVPISPFSSDLFRFALLVFGNTPISSDLFRFLPICSDLISEQISETPFCRPLLQIPDSSFFCLQLSFFAYSGKMCLRSTSTDCKQRSSTVSKKLQL